MGEKDVRGMVFSDFGSVKKAKRGCACIYKRRERNNRRRKARALERCLFSPPENWRERWLQKKPQDCGDLWTGRGKH